MTGQSKRSLEAVDPLFEPLAIGPLTLRNRIVMSAMTRERSPGGVPGPDVAAYYRRRAEGEVGLIITEGAGIDEPSAVDSTDIPVLHGNEALTGWCRVVEEVHAAGGVIFPQLWHQGVMRVPSRSTRPELRSLRPSGSWGPPGRTTALTPAEFAEISPRTRAMTHAEIDRVIDAYARSARYAVAVGFDGIAIHGAHGYLIDSFFWRETNGRTDRYGGDLLGRTRFAVEVVQAIRSEIGEEKPIIFRFSQWKQQDFQARLAETPTELEGLLGPLADAGVDAFDASTRYFDSPAFAGSDLTLAGWAKKVTGRVSMAVGGVGLSTGTYETLSGRSSKTNSHNIDRLRKRLGCGEFDLVGVGRSILGDPNWARRVRLREPFIPFEREALACLT